MFSHIFRRNFKILPLVFAYSLSPDFRRLESPYYSLSVYRPSSSSLTNDKHPSTKDRIRGEYENKIRMFSTPEKIFEIFATVKKDGVLYMSYSDLFKAICPFNYSEKPEKPFEPHESSALIKLCDMNKDGLIDIYEYVILVSFLQMNQNEILDFFKKSFPEKTTLGKEELTSFLYHLRDKAKVKLTMTNVLPDPRKVHLTNEKYQEVIQKTVDNMTAANPNLTIGTITGLKNELLQEIYDYEFRSFPSFTDEKINEEDFAKSIICFLEIPLVPSYLKHLEKFKFSDEMITRKNYFDFHQFFKDNYHLLEKKVKNKGALTRSKLKKMITEDCKNNKLKISDRQIDIFVHILDINGDNRIDTKEFLGVIKNRSFYGSPETHALDQPFVSLTEFLTRSLDKLTRIYEIIKE